MSSHTRQREREERRRLNIRTLVVASVASATAAVITSQFWIAGTWVAAAMTPVIVAIVSEALHRPTERLADRITSDRSAVLPEAAGAGPPPRRPDEELPQRAPPDPGSAPKPGEAPVRVYRSTARPQRRRGKVLAAVAATALLAFAAAAIAITGTELLTGGSIGKGDRDTTLFGGTDRDRRERAPERTEPEEEAPAPAPQEEEPEQEETEPAPEEQPEEEPQPTTPDDTVPSPEAPTVP